MSHSSLFGALASTLLASALWTTGLTSAGGAHGARQTLPQFQTRTDLVSVDVSVVDRNQVPITDLTATEFSLLDDGKPQSIELFQHVRLKDGTDPKGTARDWIDEVENDVARNEDIADRRLIVIIMDDAMIPFDGQMVASAKQIARAVVDRLGPNDLGAVIFTRDNRPAQNFTNDRGLLHRAVDSFESAGFIPAPGVETDPLPYPRDAMLTLFRTVSTLKEIGGRRKTILYVSTGIPLVVDAPDRNVTKSDQPYLNWLAKNMLRLAQEGNINIHTIDPSGLDGLRAFMSRRNTRSEAFIIERIEQAPQLYSDFLRATADNTGGHAYTNTNDFVGSIDRIVRDTGSFYLLGYSPNPPKKADGRFHRIQVKVSRRGAAVVSRTGYFAASASETAPALGIRAADEALRGLVPKTQLPLQSTALQLRIPGQTDTAIFISARVSAPSIAGVPLPKADTADLSVAAFSPEGVLKRSYKSTVDTKLEGGSAEYEVITRIDLPPGRYELRLAIMSRAWQASGSVHSYLTVADARTSSTGTSGIAIAPSDLGSSGEASGPFSILPIRPTTKRAFSRTEQVTAFLRLYFAGVIPASPPIKAMILDRGGRTIIEGIPQLQVSNPLEPHWVDVRWTLPLGRLDPGQYVLRIDTPESPPVRSQIRFEVR